MNQLQGVAERDLAAYYESAEDLSVRLQDLTVRLIC